MRVEEIEEPNMREIRYLDNLVDELAKGKKTEKIQSVSLQPTPARRWPILYAVFCW